MAMPTYARASRGSAAGGKIGITGSSIYMKVTRTEHDFRIENREKTADGDTAAQYAPGAIVRGRLLVIGWMIAGQKAGYASGDFASGTGLDWTQTWSTNRTLTGTFLVERVRVGWNERAKTRDYLPVMLSGVFNGEITEA